ncbi:MAG: hypothetical protein LIP09_16605 [Bacteroidales bacterium]|nr:hypothetical protein [Bacteroidales bacterium]
MINDIVGVGGSLGYWKNYYEDGWAAGKDWAIDSEDNKPSNLYLKPSIVLKSPSLNIKGIPLALYVEPGLMLNIPYQRVWIEKTPNWPNTDYDHISTSKGQWLAGEARIGINVELGPGALCVGYFMSNLDIYSQYRHLSYQGISFKEFYPSKPFMQGAFITLVYHF